MIAYTQRDTLGREAAVTNLRLDLKGAGNFPDWIFSLANLQELHLFNADFGRIHFSAWPWPRLEKLKLINCGLEAVTISGTEPIALQLLDLSENRGMQWPDQLLKKMSPLQVLHFSNNALPNTELDGLENCTQLRALYLSANALSRIPATVFQLGQLRILDVSQNQISQIPEVVGELQQLDQLIATANRLKTLPESFGRLTTLSQLLLGQNRLIALPMSMQYCMMLRKLELRKNRFVTFPAFLHLLPWLSELDLAHNRLQALPESLGVFRQLTRLDLSYNRLQYFAPGPDTLPKIRELKLDNNQLRDLPALPANLLSLSLSGNQFDHIPATLLQLPDLKDLYLDRNRIASLPENFGKLQHTLIRWGMAGNPVRTTAENLLELRQLKEINGLLSPARQKDLLLAQQTARSLDLPENLSVPFYRLLHADRSVLSGFDAEALLPALNHPVEEVGARVRKYVQKEYSLPLKGHRLGKGSILGIAGRTFFDRTHLEERLETLGISLQPEYDPQSCTHLLLGFPIIAQPIPPDRHVIFNEKQLVLRLDQLEKKPLLQERSESRLKRLQQLLTSPDTTNIQLAFRMIKGNGLPPSLWNELLAAYYLCERDPALQLQIKSYLRLRLEDEGKNKFFAALTPQLIKWGKIKPEKEKLLQRNRFDLRLVQAYLK